MALGYLPAMYKLSDTLPQLSGLLGVDGAPFPVPCVMRPPVSPGALVLWYGQSDLVNNHTGSAPQPVA